MSKKQFSTSKHISTQT